MISKKTWALVAILGFGSGFLFQTIYDNTHYERSAKAACIDVYVDYGSLVPSSPSKKCVDVIGTISAEDLLRNSGYTLEGTRKYPDQIVCRVNSLPSKDVEPCKDMPPADAYWAIIVEKDGHWDWAETGISSIQLTAGEGIGLSYVVDGKTNFPN